MSMTLSIYICYNTDIDECSTKNGNCDQVCTNTVGLFNCSCNDGYSLNTDGETCDGQLQKIVMIQILNVCLACVVYRY